MGLLDSKREFSNFEYESKGIFRNKGQSKNLFIKGASSLRICCCEEKHRIIKRHIS